MNVLEDWEWDYIPEEPEVFADYEIDLREHTERVPGLVCDCDPVVLVGLFEENWATEIHYIDGKQTGRIKVLV